MGELIRYHTSPSKESISSPPTAYDSSVLVEKAPPLNASSQQRIPTLYWPTTFYVCTDVHVLYIHVLYSTLLGGWRLYLHIVNRLAR